MRISDWSSDVCSSDLAAVIDWFSRRVLSWRLSTTQDTAFCLEAGEEALARHGRPAIFHTDQGSQSTSAAFNGLLLANGIAISIDGRGAWREKVFLVRTCRFVLGKAPLREGLRTPW